MNSIPKCDHKRVALQHPKIQTSLPIIEIRNANATLSTLLHCIFRGPSTGHSIGEFPDILDRLRTTTQSYALDSHTTLILRTRGGEIFRGDMQCTSKVCKSVLRVTVRLLKGEMDVWRVVPARRTVAPTAW